MVEYTIQISTKLIDQLARDDEKVKRKVRKPKPKKVVEQQPGQPQDNASRGASKRAREHSPAPAPGWSLPPPMYLPVTPAPRPPPLHAIQEAEAIRAVVAESAKVLEKLDKAEAERQQELARRAKELHDREFKLPYQNPVPCADKKAACRECYMSNAGECYVSNAAWPPPPPCLAKLSPSASSQPEFATVSFVLLDFSSTSTCQRTAPAHRRVQ